jgi:hypothetical protein
MDRGGNSMMSVKRMASATAVGAAMLISGGLLATAAKAAYVVTLEQVGSNVVATGSGTLDLTDLTFEGDVSTIPFIRPNFGGINTGAAETVATYGSVTGPTSFGIGSFTDANSGTGDLVGVNVTFSGSLGVPSGYVSDSALMDGATYDNATFSSLFATPGTYEWTWGTGPHADSFTLQIGAAPSVPEPSSLALIGVALIGLPLVRTNRRTIPKISN